MTLFLKPTMPLEHTDWPCAACGEHAPIVQAHNRSAMIRRGAKGGASPTRRANVPVWHCAACDRSQPGRKDVCRYCGEKRHS